MLDQPASFVRVAIFTAVALLMLGPEGNARAEAPTAATHTALCFEPPDWVGKYPAGKTASGPGFIDLPCIRAPLKALLPAPEFNRLMEALLVDEPIRIVGGHLIVARCEAHACPADHGMIAVDLERGTLVVALYRRSVGGSAASWYSNGRDPLELPLEIRQLFLRKHTPAP